MRILNVIMCLDPVAGGGSVERVYQLSKHLALAGEDCTILTTRQGWSDEHVRSLGNVKVVALPYVTERFKVPVGLFRWLHRHIAEYDMVHLAMNWTLITAVAYLYLRWRKRPYVYSAMGWLAIDGRSRLIKHLYRALFTRRIIKNAQSCIAVTKREVDDYEKAGVPRAKIAWIPNGFVNELPPAAQGSAADFRLRNNIDARPFILFIGRLNTIKGPDLLIGAFAAVAATFPRYQLVIAGNDYGGFLGELKCLAREHALEDRVTFVGPVFGSEKWSAYRTADLFVIPSRFDTMTIVALEAAASATPVLLTHQCDFDELPQAGGGVAVDASVNGLEDGLRQVLSKPEELRAMGLRGRDFVDANYRWETICRQFMELFRKCASADAGHRAHSSGVESLRR